MKILPRLPCKSLHVWYPGTDPQRAAEIIYNIAPSAVPMVLHTARMHYQWTMDARRCPVVSHPEHVFWYNHPLPLAIYGVALTQLLVKKDLVKRSGLDKQELLFFARAAKALDELTPFGKRDPEEKLPAWLKNTVRANTDAQVLKAIAAGHENLIVVYPLTEVSL